MFRAELLLIAVLSWAACKREPVAAPPQQPMLSSVGPRLIANDSAYPLYLHGDGFVESMELEVQQKRFAVTKISATLGSTVVDGLELPAGESIVTLEAKLLAGGAARGAAPLIVANDADYPWPYDLAVIEGRVFVASPTTDTVWQYSTDASPTAIAVGDRPRALAHYRDADAKDWLVVVHELDARIMLLAVDDPAARPRVIDFRAQSQGIAVHGALAYITNRLTDHVHVVDLAKGEQVASWRTGHNPRAVALGEGQLAVSNLTGDDLVLVDPATGKLSEVVVGPGSRIVGGHTAAFSDSVIGLKAPRDLVWSPRHEVFLAATLGPNIGPNSARMEISMNSGVSVIAADGTFRHHVSMLRGNAERIAIDEAIGVVLATDISRGRVVAFNLDRVVAGEPAVIAQFFVTPPDATKPLRPTSAELDETLLRSMYSGPSAIVLDGGSAFVLNRFTGTVSQLDYRDALNGELRLIATWPGPDLGKQTVRRAGEVVFGTDVADSRMSCDTCHHEGHNQGTLFTKGNPMHIYRTTSLRSISETAPYFTPAKFPTLARISHFVTARNRMDKTPPTTDEVAALTLFQQALAPPPNPYLGQSKVSLPDGNTGDPIAGAAHFAQSCSGCHPPPMFTPDQDPKTRGKLYHTGEVTIPLRLDQQDHTPYPVPVPTLVAVWDNHPLFHGGQVGNKVVDGRLVPTPFPLAELLDKANHFDASGLEAQARRDLLAFVLTL